MLKTGLFTLLVILTVTITTMYFFRRSSVSLSIKPESGDYFPKENIHMRLLLKNSGLSAGYFFIDLKSDFGSFPPRVLYLKRNGTYETSIDVSIPTSTPKGMYNIEVAAGTMRIPLLGGRTKPGIIAKKKVTVTVKEIPVPEIKIVEKPKVIKIVKPPEPISGIIKFVSFGETLNYGVPNPVGITVENTSDRTAQFNVQCNVAGTGENVKTFSSEVSLSSGAATTLAFELTFSPAETPGQYYATGELREPLTNRLIQSDSVASQLTDAPPRVELKDFFTSPVQKNKYEIIAHIADDTGASGAEVFYSDLKRKYTTSYAMNMIYGSAQDSIWSCSFVPYKKSKEFKFYIEARDIRNNVSRTGEKFSAALLGTGK